MKRALLEIAVLVLLALGAGAAYTLAAGKLELTVREGRYPNARVCHRSGGGSGNAAPASPGGPESGSSASRTPGPAAGPEPAEPGPPEGGAGASRPGGEEPAAGDGSGAGEGRRFPLRKFEEFVPHWRDLGLVVDARSPKRYRAGHIPGAVSIPAWEPGIEARIEALAKTEPLEAPLFVYCNRSEECEDSVITATNLEAFGFLDISIYEGGFPDWSERKQPVVEGEEPGPRGGAEAGGER